MPRLFDTGLWRTGIWDGSANVTSTAVAGGGSSAPPKDDWWRSPPGKKKRRKASTTDKGAPNEAPLSVSDDTQRAARLAEELEQARRRAVAASIAQAEVERQRLAALAAEDELVLLLAA